MEENATNKFFYLEDENHHMVVPFIFTDEQQAIQLKDAINNQNEHEFQKKMLCCESLLRVLYEELSDSLVKDFLKKSDMEKPKTVNVVEVPLFDINEFKISKYFQELCE